MTSSWKFDSGPERSVATWVRAQASPSVPVSNSALISLNSKMMGYSLASSSVSLWLRSCTPGGSLECPCEAPALWGRLQCVASACGPGFPECVLPDESCQGLRGGKDLREAGHYLPVKIHCTQ